MTLLYASPRFLDHDTGHHPENAGRLQTVAERLAATGLDQACLRPHWLPASEQSLLAVHEADYLAELARLCGNGGGLLDGDTVASRDSWSVAQLAAGAACDAVRRVVAAEGVNALCLVRPPGHHALPQRAMGFCLLGNAAIAARYALDQCQLNRVLIVDWDVHHGNGTQDVFYRDGRVGFFSAHRWPFYPGTGAADETGAGDGLGATRNLPTEFGSPRREFLTCFADELADFAARIRPQLIVISAGFDAHALDPVGSLGLETEDFAELTRIVGSVAADWSQGRLVSILEGGYNPPILAECVETHLRELLTFDDLLQRAARCSRE